MPPPGKISLKEVSNCEYNDFSESVYEPVAIPITASGKWDGRRRDNAECDRGGGCVGKLRCRLPSVGAGLGLGRKREAIYCRISNN